jgi:hypothetical protein
MFHVEHFAETVYNDGVTKNVSAEEATDFRGHSIAKFPKWDWRRAASAFRRRSGFCNFTVTPLS